VIVEAYATRDGRVDRVEVMSCDRPGYGFEEATIAAVEKWRFDPGVRDGTSVDLFFTLVFEFKIEP
jgi:TonB family protein